MAAASAVQPRAAGQQAVALRTAFVVAGLPVRPSEVERTAAHPRAASPDPAPVGSGRVNPAPESTVTGRWRRGSTWKSRRRWPSNPGPCRVRPRLRGSWRSLLALPRVGGRSAGPARNTTRGPVHERRDQGHQEHETDGLVDEPDRELDDRPDPGRVLLADQWPFPLRQEGRQRLDTDEPEAEDHRRWHTCLEYPAQRVSDEREPVAAERPARLLTDVQDPANPGRRHAARRRCGGRRARRTRRRARPPARPAPR